METEIPKVYSPDEIEPRWARAWVKEKLYRPSEDPVRPRFCLVIPPPNITGSLHMGHMLEHTEIDILMRWRRMTGDDVLWLPGTDHASIATNMIVERELGREALPNLGPGPEANRAWQREGQRRRLEMGREKFVERCWKWKEANGGTIKKQMERLGASVDWTRERFTMDEAYSRAVNEAFVRLYEDGLIYRGEYIVNWCPRCLTALSDLEVAHDEREGHLWYVRYPFEDASESITVATTRPETMLGDSAVAVNPSDPRRAAFVGKLVRLPLTSRVIPVIADAYVDRDFGTGVMKVTPAHDPSDYTIARSHSLPLVRVIGPDARMTAGAGAAYEGLDRYKARERIVQDLDEQGLLGKREQLKFAIPICQRCKTVIEPLVSRQWFMKMEGLAKPAIKAVEDGRIKILPESGMKKYLNWMENIHDWCISRQLWWGHRIPAWFCDNCNREDALTGSPAEGVKQAGEIVALESPHVCPHCGSGSLRPETDVLDTWFSSALWPFATLGWPDETADLKRFYPNDLMIMGEDILFFWGARMIMMGLRFMGDVPFRKLYIHALVRDAERQKMSKTKGNVLDPLEVTEKYGTDAVRFALAISAAPGTDIAFSDDKVESYRAFANKIWNAGRFILMYLRRLPKPAREQLATALAPLPELGYRPVNGTAGGPVQLADRWIFSRLSSVTRQVNDALADFRFHEAAYTIYHFFWHEFCDWYLEWIKPEVTRPTGETKASAAWINLTRVFEAALHLLHPFMPFITEELAHALPHATTETSISLTSFALVNESVEDAVAEKEFETIRELVVAVRNAKAERNLQREKPSAQVAGDDGRLLELLRHHQAVILRLAGLKAFQFSSGRLAQAIHVNAALDLRILHEVAHDTAAERQRLEREKGKLEQSLTQTRSQLANETFLSRAPREVVKGVEQRHHELSAQYQKVVESLDRLSGGS